MVQQRQHQCGCVDNMYSRTIITDLCQGHVSIMSNPTRTQHPDMRQPQMQTSTTIPGTQSHPFAQFQMGGFGHPFQMPQRGVHIRMPQQGTGR